MHQHPIFIELLKADLKETLRQRFGEDRQKWIRVLEATLNSPLVQKMPGYQKLVMRLVLFELKQQERKG
ncbi:MAG: hypothetical protein DRO36_06805 [Candidatus Hecatellales archaeon]|nr:MAG: hypothetical protein DRO36_06805 [Candidatus Hecatellales archaeon]